MRLVLDVENEAKEVPREGKVDKLDLMPFSGRNSLVSVGIKDIDTGKHVYKFFHHNELHLRPNHVADDAREIQDILDKATLIIGHNLKHDTIWCRESGFKVPDCAMWDTSIAEYVMARGQRMGYSLEDIANTRGLAAKKTDLTKDYLAKGIGFEAMPIDIVEEYGIGDLDTTHELFDDQQKRLASPANSGLISTVLMMNEFSNVLSKWQANGIKIDRVELERVRAEYVGEQSVLIERLNDIARKYLGDTPFNLNSGEDKSVLLYSRRITDKHAWKKHFNIGTNDLGKPLRRPKHTSAAFRDAIRKLTTVEYRTKASQCADCQGKGRVSKTLKSGLQSAPRYICKPCGGCGVIYIPTGRVAGFKLTPETVHDCSVNGFVTDSDKLDALRAQTDNPEILEFLEKSQRLNAVNSYISTFCDGILFNLTNRDFLYTNFNQLVTATGRLSSSDPNFQNQPRGKTFPVRRAVVSRFVGGYICEGDFAQLEFRVAGELSSDAKVLSDILDKVDVHAFTRDVLCAAGQIVDRQDAKPHTFKPLYGGESGTPAEVTYYKAFKAKYPGIAKWQAELGEQVIATKIVKLPSGREYTWPSAKREWNGRVSFFTQIVNYPVQGFATGDIVPLACILLDRRFSELGLLSVPFLTVHDSIAVDTHPTEKDIVPVLLADCMLAVKAEMLRRYEYNFKIPLEVEVKIGFNWLDTNKVLTKAHEYVNIPDNTKKSNNFYDDEIPELA